MNSFVGRIDDTLDLLGLIKKTLSILTADNGTDLTVVSMMDNISVFGGKEKRLIMEPMLR